MIYLSAVIRILTGDLFPILLGAVYSPVLVAPTYLFCARVLRVRWWAWIWLVVAVAALAAVIAHLQWEAFCLFMRTPMGPPLEIDTHLLKG